MGRARHARSGAACAGYLRQLEDRRRRSPAARRARVVGRTRGRAGPAKGPRKAGARARRRATRGADGVLCQVRGREPASSAAARGAPRSRSERTGDKPVRAGRAARRARADVASGSSAGRTYIAARAWRWLWRSVRPLRLRLGLATRRVVGRCAAASRHHRSRGRPRSRP